MPKPSLYIAIPGQENAHFELSLRRLRQEVNVLELGTCCRILLLQ